MTRLDDDGRNRGELDADGAALEESPACTCDRGSFEATPAGKAIPGHVNDIDHGAFNVKRFSPRLRNGSMAEVARVKQEQRDIDAASGKSPEELQQVSSVFSGRKVRMAGMPGVLQAMSEQATLDLDDESRARLSDDTALMGEPYADDTYALGSKFNELLERAGTPPSGRLAIDEMSERPQLRVKLLHPDAKLPTYGSASASGLDLYAVDDCDLPAGEPTKVRIGIAVEIPPGYEAQVRPRSGLAAKGVVATFGTIDADYRGELSVILTLASEYMITHRINAGDRIAQLVIAPVSRVTVSAVDELSSTERGEGGFGSTGV